MSAMGYSLGCSRSILKVYSTNMHLIIYSIFIYIHKWQPQPQSKPLIYFPERAPETDLFEKIGFIFGIQTSR